MLMLRMESVPMPALSQFAELVNSWMVSRSPQSERALLAALAEDVWAPSFARDGRDAVLDGLAELTWRFESGLRLTPGELGATPVLQAVVQQGDGNWQRVGYFLVRRAATGAVAYLDYREEGSPAAPELSGAGGRASDSAGRAIDESPGERLKPIDAGRRLGAKRRLFGLP